MAKNASDSVEITPIERLRAFSEKCLIRVGVDQADSAAVAEVLAAADICGKESHGVARLRRYVDGCATAKIDGGAQPELLVDLPAMALLDAKNGLGQPVGIRAMDLAVEKAEKVGAAIVAVRNSNHFGIAGYYARRAAERGLIGIATSNASPQVAPTHGARPMYGTNPLGVGIPVGGDIPFLIDMSTSVVPRGKLERMFWYEKPIPPGWVVDPEGQATTDNKTLITGLKAHDGHAILPLGGAGELFSGHKGYALGILIDMLCGPLTGSLWGRRVYGSEGARLGQVFVAINVKAFLAMTDFYKTTEQFVQDLKQTPPAHGSEEVFIPGEQSARIREQRLREGVPVSQKVREDLSRLSQQYGVAF